ncbi:MAG TPA: ABC transporter ATP-binding protein [Candidatus Polarisedimenticolia bacterium]|jgi:ATP-binding cassette subfamily B protein|nr:ABC transporter ATP-binding protein [Candidatus Polarisedimenticolia bacterium]
MRFLRRALDAYRRDFLLGFACLVITNGLTLVIPWLLKHGIEALQQHQPLRLVGRYAAGIAVVAVLLAFVRTWSRWYVLGGSRRIVADLRARLFAHLQTLPASFYARHRTGEIMSRAVNDLLLVRSLFGPGVLNLINVSILYSAGLLMMAILDPRLTLAAILPYPALLYAVSRVSRTIHQRSNAAQEQLAEISNKAQENLSGIHQVKAYAREDLEVAAFSGLSSGYRQRTLALARSRGLIVVLMSGLGGLSTIIVLWFGGRHVIAGTLSLGGLVAFMSYLAILTGPTIMMGWMLGVFQRGLGAIHRLEEILAQTSDLPGDLLPGPCPPLSGQIAFRALSFAYPEGREVLHGVDLDVPAGATIGLVGPVGAGKSTLVRLLAAVFPVGRGMLLFDGHDFNDLPTRGLREQIAVVPQETFLFSRTLAENIALGRPDAPRADIERAAEIAQLTRDLSSWPHGLDTRVGERGVTLSGGQRQRVAIARAVLMDPRVLVLDDALSSVDADTEAAILTGLRRFMRGRTTFVISHRVATVAGADRLLVLEDGRVVETGTPAELLAADGPFARLSRTQQIERELEAM